MKDEERTALIKKFNIPSGFKIIDIDKGKITVRRPDNLRVFLSESEAPILNKIRLTADKKTVIQAVGIYRGMQISDNYSKKYTNSGTDYTKIFKSLLEGLEKKSRLLN